MNFVSDSFAVEELCEKFDLLLDSFRNLRACSGSGASIESTKLWAYRKQLDSLDQMDPLDAAALVGIVNKYCSINLLFDTAENIKIPQHKLLDLLDGQHLLRDEDEKYNNTFFELAMALRIAKSMDDGGGIDLTTDCDVVWYGKGLAIECKYLHSEKKFRKEFSDAMDQLERRLSDGLAKEGVVAFDLSNLVDSQVVFDFARLTFEAFAKNYENIIQSRSVFSHDLSKEGVLRSVIKDRNFITVISKFVSHQLEAVFYRNFKKSEMMKLSCDRVAVVFQVNNCLSFEYEGEFIPVPFRAMCYYINQDLSEDKYNQVRGIIHSLSVGF
jgi:hypothetical protein